MAPIIATLMAQGLSLLGNAVLAKGQEAIEEKLGVKLDSTSNLDLKRLEMQHEEWLINAAIKE